MKIRIVRSIHHLLVACALASCLAACGTNVMQRTLPPAEVSTSSQESLLEVELPLRIYPQNMDTDAWSTNEGILCVPDEDISYMQLYMPSTVILYKDDTQGAQYECTVDLDGSGMAYGSYASFAREVRAVVHPVGTDATELEEEEGAECAWVNARSVNGRYEVLPKVTLYGLDTDATEFRVTLVPVAGEQAVPLEPMAMN